MTEDSAERYDTQVEVLFKGTANAMRRQTLPQLFEVFSGHDQRDLRLIDLGCGTGRFLDLVNQAWPRLSLLGLDLSETYIRHARRHLRRRSRLDLLVANARLSGARQQCRSCHEYLHVPRAAAVGAQGRPQGVCASIEAWWATNSSRLTAERR